jgi:CRP-like cAMP-binding protein
MPYGTPPLARQLEHGRFNRFLATLPPHDFSLLAPHLRTLALERGVMLHDVGEQIEHVYFPHTGMVSLVAVMQSGATVETATIGRAGVIGASAGLGARTTMARAVVQLPGTAAWLSASHFHAAAAQSQAIRDLIVRHNDLLLSQVQQSVACNALHALEARLCRWLLQTHDCTDGNIIPLTQEFLGQMLGVRRTTVTIAARLLQGAGSSATAGVISKSSTAPRSKTSPASATASCGRTRIGCFPPPIRSLRGLHSSADGT